MHSFREILMEQITVTQFEVLLERTVQLVNVIQLEVLFSGKDWCNSLL